MGWNKGKETRRRILQAASALFAERGFEATSVREIVARAGVSKPVLYYYFTNKEDLCRRLLAESFEEFTQELMGALARPGDCRKRIEAIVWAHFRACNESLDLARFLYATSFGPESSPFSQDSVRFNDNLRRLVADAIKAMQAAGHVRKDADAEFLATVLQGEIQIWMMLEIKRKHSLLTRRLAKKITTHFFEGAAASG